MATDIITNIPASHGFVPKPKPFQTIFDISL